MDALELAEELIRFDTTSPVIEPDVFDFLKEMLAAEGIRSSIHEHNGVYSLTAETGNGEADDTTICLNGHVDVVPANNGWTVTDPFEPAVVDDKLYGRGAADMKGGLAAQVMAFIDLHNDDGFDGTATLMVVGDEELGGYDGTAALLEDTPRIDYTLIGEPTDCNIQVGTRGIFWVDIYLQGTSVHASRPHTAHNLVEDLPRVLNALASMELTYAPDDDFPEPTAPITTVETEGPQNSLPGQIRVGMDIRNLPGQTGEQVEADLRDVLDPLGVTYELRVADHGAAFKLTDETFKQIATETVEDVMGRTPDHVTDGGASDGRFFAEHGTPFIELGPDQNPGHQADEYCRIDDLKKLRAAYREIAKRLATQRD